jgi:predicted ribonuclease YlaK
MIYTGKLGRGCVVDDELEMEDVFVLDTSVIIEDPRCFFNLGRKWVIVPTAVIGELDGLKRSTDSIRPSSTCKAPAAILLCRKV